MTSKRRKQTRNLRLAGTRSPAIDNKTVHMMKDMRRAGAAVAGLDRAARKEMYSFIRFFKIGRTK